jgi:hypothetical protein
MEIRHWQKLSASSLYPIFSFVALTFGTMPVAARVITDGQMTTSIASIDMTTQFGSSTFLYG